MSISFYQTPAFPPDEEARTRSVDSLRAWERRDDAVLAELMRSLRRRFAADLAAVSVLRGDTQHVLAADGLLASGVYERRRSFCGHAVLEGGDLYCVPDLAADPRFAGNPWVSGDSDRLRFYAAALVRDADGLAVGAVCVAGTRARVPLSAAEGEALVRAGRAASDRLLALAALRPARPSAAGAASRTSPAPPP